MGKLIEFKLIEGCPDYMVSSDGKVWSLKYGKMKELKPWGDRYGYLRVCLFSNGRRVYKLVHRLVAEAFIANPNNLPEVNHKDEDKKNNCFHNLEWCDRNYNNNYGTRNERLGKTQTNRKDLSIPVLCVETGEVFPSAQEASRQTGIHRPSISNCLNGRYKTTGGYHWRKFIEGDNSIYS